jgi:NAD(P)-dependent dehydrogenase (short-subunit alcohol dehydrogenase family)
MLSVVIPARAACASPPVDLGDSSQARRWVADAEATTTGTPPSATSDLVFYVTQAAWPHLVASGGVILNTASVQGLVAITNGGIAHTATKAAMIAMTRQMAAEGAPHGTAPTALGPARSNPLMSPAPTSWSTAVSPQPEGHPGTATRSRSLTVAVAAHRG